ncbi:hypothetical protein PHYBLDRAFT_143054 [Phycomyces blakesleeanus NRRL 1555(-)]|uniref:Uncharacterized protein n=1 Tax=Phycomyces blakesleeanus (strain ATCC 8743b / DSM 1359 / FGSC 10004 / NBRC 33097 / NRRL 1555) TaxID=763407 RepID=A0A163AVB5_PHYB8|nr:hypothetical protein PHYBLDRAFT_143054 [Phycomyces blakesleeanus NRRL 1555(-)]OAD76071.1 hypothetical protein PHYBLDRAFT_143054 [Phycomyces blakesleeanus NRRL 1555(-)]|eukprot:XP_018294111.1 hypothetical protein PHYBLDRAFT_143054 [Phycomyces blakesleeanus NRRL 1555(-)]
MASSTNFVPPILHLLQSPLSTSHLLRGVAATNHHSHRLSMLGNSINIRNDRCVVPEFLLANQDDDYTEFSFENDDRSDFLLLTKELEST